MVHRRYILRLLVGLLVLSTTGVGAVDTLQVTTPDPLLEDWRWTEYDRRSGLAGKTCEWVYEDRDGNIWFATDGGAQKYDGLRWTTYTTEDGLAHNNVIKIKQARDGAMWIGTGDGSSAGITRLIEASDKGETKATTDTFEGWGYVYGISEATDGTVWIILEAGNLTEAGNLDDIRNLRRYVNGQWETVNQPVWAFGPIVQDREGAIWTGTLKGAGLRFDGVRWTQVVVRPDTASVYTRVFLDAADNILIRHNKGFSRFNRGVLEHHATPEGPPFFAKNGIIWMGGLSGELSRYQNGQLDTYDSAQLPFLRGLVFPYQTRDGVLWFTTRNRSKAYRVDMTSAIQVYTGADRLLTGPEGSDGAVWFHTPIQAVRFVDGVWLGYGPKDGFLDGNVRAMDRSADGSIWVIGTHKGQGAVARYRSDRWQIFTQGVIDDPTALMPTRDGKVWVMGTHEGKGAVCHFDSSDGNDGPWQRETSVFQGGRVTTSYEASDGTLWFGDRVGGDQGTGLYRYDLVTQVWMNFGEEDGFVASHSSHVTRYGTRDGLISGLAEWPTGTLWVGTGWGIYEIDLADLPEKRTFYQRPAEAFEILQPKFRNLTPTADALWFHPYYPRSAGVIRYDGKTWQAFKEEDGLPEDGILGIFRTKEGAVWFQGTQGLSRFKALPDRSEGGWTRFQENLLPPFSFGKVTETRDGSFWLNTDSGVARVPNLKIQDPETFLDPAPQSVSSDGDILFRYSGRTKWDATPAEDLTYTWRLDGGKWTQTRNGIVNFADLSAGPHTFEVRTLAPNLNTDPTPGVHAFIVAVPWWRDPLVAGPGLLLIIALIFQSVRVLRSERKLKQSVVAMSVANHELFDANKALQRDRAVERIRGQVQSMEAAVDFEKVLSLLTDDLKEVGLNFQVCEIDVLDEPVQAPTMAFFETNGFHYTTYRLGADGHVTSRSYRLSAPFPTVIEQTIQRFIDGEPWQGTSEGQAIVEVPAGGYGRLRLTALDRDVFDEDEVATLREFAGAVALGYARYLDIRVIQEATERKSAFLASMSHELRTPMNAIKGFANLVRRREPSISDRGKENLEKVDQASDHLLAMINDLLDLSKIEAGRMDVNVSTFEVEKLVASCVSTVSPLVQEGVILDYSVQSDIGEVHSDEQRVRQMLINLASNAIKFTDAGRIDVKAKKEGDALVLSVSDTGKGIPEDELATIFDEYRQVEGVESVVQKGTGLGLSITKKFAELLGGTISVESEVGEGSVFTVKIPANYES